jgi:hypothetical protein
MRQVKPGDMAVIISSFTAATFSLVGTVCTVGDLHDGYSADLPQYGPWFAVHGVKGIIAQPSYRLMPINPDESITQEQDEGVAA